MIISTINGENAQPFKGIIPADLFCRIDRDGWFALGAVLPSKEGEFAAGVLIFTIEEGLADGESITAAVLQWYYVAKQFRRRGVGKALMMELFRVLKESNVLHILCDVPFSAEYNELCATFISMGFTINLTDVYEATITVKEAARHPLLRKKGSIDGIVPLSQVPAYSFGQYIALMKERPDVPYDLSESAEDYDRDVSCAFLVGGKVAGTFLVERNPESAEVKLFRTAERNGKAMMDMLRYSVAAAAKKYPAETPVYISVRFEEAASTIDKLFPDMNPMLVRRAYYSMLGLPEEENGKGEMEHVQS